MKIELHTHTKESSPCSKTDAAQIVRLYKGAGYDAIVITDHYNKWCMEQMGAASSEEYNEYVLSGYETAKKAARDAINGWDPTGGAIYYYNPAKTSNRWIRTRPVVTTIGRHVFCK